MSEIYMLYSVMAAKLEIVMRFTILIWIYVVFMVPPATEALSYLGKEVRHW